MITKRIVAFITVLFVIGAWSVIYIVDKNMDNSDNFGRLLVRSLHAPGEIPSGYIKVFEDEETDRIFFINPDVGGFTEQYSKVIIPGQPKACTVVEQYDNYMLVRVISMDKVYGGLSGAGVVSEDGESIGFISEVTKDGLLKVIANK